MISLTLRVFIEGKSFPEDYSEEEKKKIYKRLDEKWPNKTNL